MTAQTLANAAFAPTRPAPRPPASQPTSLLRRLVAFYRERPARLALIVTALVLSYLGGGVLFTLHSIVLGEGGPAISPIAHWLLDSTAGFVGLTPALVLILPIAARLALRDGVIRPGRFALYAGLAFTTVTAPGPILHDLLVARGTWIADRVTGLLGATRAPSGVDIPAAASITAQVLVGAPTYVLLTWLAIHLTRRLTRRG